jgi:hypothetical protein
MPAIKARYSKGKIELPPGLPEHEPCEVTVLFPEANEKGKEEKRRALRESAGVWRHLDTEALKKRIYEARRISRRPKPEL